MQISNVLGIGNVEKNKATCQQRAFSAVPLSQKFLNEGVSFMVVARETEEQEKYWVNLHFFILVTYRKKKVNLYMCLGSNYQFNQILS